jgi:aarF domain-containing kinase
MKSAHVESIMVVGLPFKTEGEFDFANQQITGKIYELIPVMLKHR